MELNFDCCLSSFVSLKLLIFFGVYRGIYRFSKGDLLKKLVFFVFFVLFSAYHEIFSLKFMQLNLFSSPILNLF